MAGAEVSLLFRPYGATRDGQGHAANGRYQTIAATPRQQSGPTQADALFTFGQIERAPSNAKATPRPPRTGVVKLAESR